MADLLSGTNLQPQWTSSTKNIALAKQAAGQILSSYPDYGKAPKEYIASVTEYLAGLPDFVVTRMADRHLGIAAKCQFLPTIADLKAYADAVLEMRARQVRYAGLQDRRPASAPVRKPFRPFPKLWEAFADEPEIIAQLDKARSFDFLFDASRIFAMRGKDAARKLISPPAEG